MVKKHKNKIIALLLLIVLCMSFSLSVFASNVIDDIIDKDKNDNMDTLTSSDVPKETLGLGLSSDWSLSDYDNVFEYPHITFSGYLQNKNNKQSYTQHYVYGVNLDDYICVGYIYNNGVGFSLLCYDKDTKEYVGSARLYHRFVIEDIIYDDGSVGSHNEIENGDLYHYTSDNFFTSILKTNVPIFHQRSLCDNYAQTFVADDAYAVPDSLKCESPQNISVYCDNNNKYLFNCVWYQTDSITSNYRTNIELIYYYVKGQEFSESKNITLNNAYVTSNDNSISFDVSDIVSSLNIGFMCDEIRFNFKCTNYDVTGAMCSSDYSVGAVRVFPDSVLFEYYDEQGNLVESVPLKTETQYKNDNGYSISDFTSVDTYTNEGFLNLILSGFGLIGSGGLVPFLAAIYQYVPDYIWILIGSGLSFMIIVAIFKLVVK